MKGSESWSMPVIRTAISRVKNTSARGARRAIPMKVNEAK
jgi:hypothetical protein